MSLFNGKIIIVKKPNQKLTATYMRALAQALGQRDYDMRVTGKARTQAAQQALDLLNKGWGIKDAYSFLLEATDSRGYTMFTTKETI